MLRLVCLPLVRVLPVGVFLFAATVIGLSQQALAGERSGLTTDPFARLNLPSQRAGAPSGAPLVRPRVGVGFHDGELMAATDARFQLLNTTSHAGDLRAQWQGSLVFENNERQRTWDDIQKGDLGLVLSHARGDQCFLNFRGTPDLQVVGVGGSVHATRRVVLQTFAQETFQLHDHGRSRATYLRGGLDVRLSSTWFVQPALYRIDARAHEHVGWTGFHLYSERRGTSLSYTDEGERSSRIELLHNHRVGAWTLRTGAQRLRVWQNEPRRLWQWGLQHAATGFDVYHGRDQLALLLQWRSVAVGRSWSPQGVQQVVGVDRFSAWVVQTPAGGMDFGVGVAFRGFLRRFALQEEGWSSFAPIHRSAQSTPHFRWPGFGSTL